MVRPGRTVRIPRRSFAALLVVMLVGVSRSVMARSTLITAILTPLLVRSAGQEVTASIAFFVTAAAAAVLGANGFAYDGGAAVWLLGKAGRLQLLAARLITTTIWAFLLSLVAATSAALVGAAPPAAAAPPARPRRGRRCRRRARPVGPPTHADRLQLLPGAAGAGGLGDGHAGPIGRPHRRSCSRCRCRPRRPPSRRTPAFALWHAWRIMRDPVALAALT